MYEVPFQVILIVELRILQDSSKVNVGGIWTVFWFKVNGQTGNWACLLYPMTIHFNQSRSIFLAEVTLMVKV